MKAFRLAAAWVLGIAVWLLVAHTITLAGDWLGVPSSIDHDPPLLDENDMEEFSSGTLFGHSSGVFAGLVGAWAGQALFHRSLGAGFSVAGTLTFRGWLVGSAVVAVLGGLIGLVFRHGHGAWAFYGQMLIEAAAIVGVGYLCRLWWSGQNQRIPKQEL